MIDDPNALMQGFQAAKLGFETLRSMLSVFKDAKDLLPSDQKKAVEEAIEQGSKQFALAEAEIAKGLGYEICKCEFPPTPMLTVGYSNARGRPPGAVFECPKCGFNTSVPFTFTRIKNADGNAD